MFPVFALILMIVGTLGKNPVLTFFSAIFWFASSLTTSNIIFIGEFGYDTTYTALGNPEWNPLYNGLGAIMILVTLGLIAGIAYQAGWLQKKQERGRE